jgi:hypothetical protein
MSGDLLLPKHLRVLQHGMLSTLLGFVIEVYKLSRQAYVPGRLRAEPEGARAGH